MAYDRTLTARRILLAKATSALALATGLAVAGTGNAQAQAFEGTPTVVSGGVVINRTTGNDDIRVDTSQAVINWTTNDTGIGGGVINFLPAFRTATYRNNPTAQNQFTVLNRIIPNDPNRPIGFSGTIISQLQTGAGVVPGGNVWFYSPGGIVVGASAVIDVGGLLLTSLDPVRDGNGDFINAGGSFTLGPAASPTSYVQVNPGAQVRLTPQNSYVAMVAPIIRQNGNVTVNGTAAYVAAEAATMTFGNGLFDIQVTTGTNGDAAAGNSAIAHNGNTTGPASSGAGDNHRIYMVAVPKNNAITMAIGAGSTLGFDVAGAADVDGNSIILSSGFNVSGDTIDVAPVNPAQQASINISSGTITSAINAASSFRTNVGVGSGTLSLAGNARFHGDNQSTVTAFGAGQIIASRDLTVSSDRVGLTDGQAVTGGNAQLYAQAGGTVRVLGNAFVTANGFGGGSSTAAAVGSGTGGIADVRSFGNSLLDIAGNLTVNADGFAGGAESFGSASNFGRGGTVIVTSGRNATGDVNSTMVVNGSLLVTANGFGSSNFGGGVGGQGFGGSIQIESGSSSGLGSLNNVLTVNGTILANADGFGGAAFVNGTGGAGTGGSVSLNAGAGGRINTAAPVTLTSFGFGGNADDGNGNGGNGQGGSAIAQIFATGGVLSLGSDLTLQATGVGGISGTSATSTGGTGRGGLAQLAMSAAALPPGGTISVQGQIQIDALGLGGSGVFGGDGFGGALGSGGGALLTMANAGTMTLNGGVRMSSGGVGGSATTSGVGRSGNGTGGTTQIVASGTGGTINITGLVDINANGAVFGSSLTGIDGGDGRGGAASISQTLGGLIIINGDAIVSATGTGDSNSGGGDGIAGIGVGGDARIVSNRDTVTITGNAAVDARGLGGFNNGGLRGGDGIGGLVNIGAGAAGAPAGFATVSIGGHATATADGTGGASFTAGSGGDGLGGQAIIGAIDGGVIQIGSFVDATAQGFGGNAVGTGSTGGLGDGGTAQLFAGARGVVTVGGVTSMNASAFGGSASGGANSGAAVGGFADVSNGTGNGQITLGQDVFLSSQGLSGDIRDGSGNVGAATGGTSRIRASGTGSVITINGSVFADAIAGTGSAVTGTIADATGGIVDLSVGSGTLNIAGAASLDASAFGGNSTLTGNGGNATGGRTLVVNTNEGNGFITITGATTMVANGTGGTAQTGNGGNGTGGRNELGTINIQSTQTYGGIVSLTATGQGGSALLVGNGGAGIGGDSRFGSNNTVLRAGDVFISAMARGGDGALGGRGGDATGGFALLISDTGFLPGLVDLDNVSLSVDAFGGAGGAGANGAIGGAGGAGGNATAGDVQAFGAAGNGVLDIGNLQISANGFGGTGGAGGTGSSGLGGAGGAGGNAIGGFNQFGTISSVTNGTDNSGSARMLDVFAQATGFGGTGGAGGSGATGAGNGGAGGSGEGGRNALLVRGSRVALNNATLVSDGFGGNGGAGATFGAGGNGIGGTVGFLITERFQIPANRGRLEANDLLGIAGGVGGSGSVTGQSLFGRGSNIEVRNADAIVGSLVVNVNGNAPSAGPDVEDFLRVTDGLLSVGGSLTYVTPNRLSVLVNNGSIDADAFGISAGNFINDTVITAPTNLGTITANAISLLSSNNIIVGANLATPGDFSAVASGAILLGDINAGGVIGMQGASLLLGNLTSGNHINLTSTSGAIDAGAISAANFIAMTAANGLTLSTATATSGYIDLLVNAGDMTIGNLTAGDYIVLDTRAGNMVLGNIQSGNDTDIEAVGSVQFGNAVTGLEFAIEALGSITGGNVNAAGAVATTSYSVGLLSQTGSITVGNLTGARNIGFVSAGPITTGSLTSGENIIALGAGNIQFNGPVTAGSGAGNYFYIGNASMVSLLGADFDPAPLFAVTPVRTPGSLTVGGALSAGNIRAGVGTSATFGGTATAATGSIAVTANSIAAQAMNAALGVNLTTTTGALTTGSILATAGNIVLNSAGAITSGALATGTGANLAVTVDGAGAVSIGGVTATGAAQLRSRSASFGSTGAITAASVSISGTAATLANVTSTTAGITIGATGGNLAFGALNSATNTQFNVAGSVTGGDITAGTSIGTIVTGNMTLGNLRTTAAGTTSTGFSIGLGAGGSIVTGTINSFGLLGIGSDDGQGNFGNAASITTGAITAGGTVLARATQAIVTGNITSTNEIRVRGGSVTTGALQATNAVFAAATNGSLTTGNVTAGTNALLLASQNVNTGGIATGNPATGPGGIALVASSAGVSPTGNLSTIDLNALLAATPQRVGGSVSIGATTTGTLLAASTGTFSANSTITAGTRISLDVGGTAVFGGLAAAPTIAISSGDIAFSQNGGLGNANTGTITLTANRSGSVVIGGTTSDSQSSGTYALDGSEISRIRAQNIVINAPNVSSTGTGVEIRALTLNGSSATSGVNLNGAEGSLTINTPGTIRVNGNAVFNSMAATNRVSLNAGRVEINADTGGIFLNGSSPGGTLSINATNIHVASAELLGRLAENVNFTGRDTALSLPIATSRPDGVLQASTLQFTVGSTLFIQNTGTALLNAGFFGRVGSFQVTPRSSQQGSSSPIDLVIYGQLLDTGDLVRNGTSVRDLIFPRSTSSSGQDSGGPSGFTSTSSINGCLLSAISCGGGGITEQSPTVISHAGPPPPTPAAEREAQQEQEEAEAAAEEAARGEAAPRKPIMPPVTIVNTRRLGVEPIIDEPVTSGGNPNLQLDQPLTDPLPDTGGQP